MLSRRTALTLMAVLPLLPLAAACSSSTGTTSGSSPTEQTSTHAADAVTNTGAVQVFAPGAFAAHQKSISEFYASTGRGSITFAMGHTPMQRAQLAQGAAPDVWISASESDMTAAADAGLVDKGAVAQLARTKLIVIVAPGNPGGVNSLGDLDKPGLKLLVGADTIPIGKGTDAMLPKVGATQSSGWADRVKANIVSRELGSSRSSPRSAPPPPMRASCTRPTSPPTPRA